jgi:hypothetical protein
VIDRGLGVQGVSPPEEVARVKAIACELPRTQGVPLSRFSRAELHRLVVERGVCEASASTIARWLAEDALKPWQHRSWIFPTDPAFLEKARAGTRPLPGQMGGQAAPSGRVRDLRRREAVDPGAGTHPPAACALKGAIVRVVLQVAAR